MVRETDHKATAPTSLKCGVVTVSDSAAAGTEDDLTGPYIVKFLEKNNFTVIFSEIVPDEQEQIVQQLTSLIDNSVDILIFTGGTGISSRDITVDAVQPYFTKDIPGFGELFRMLSYEEIGSKTMLSRVCAGVIDKAVVFCVPGSPKAVKLAMDLILKEAGHLVKHARS